MKTPGIALAVMTLSLATTAIASPIDGAWLTPSNHGVVEISECDGGLCGRVVTSDRIKANPAQADARNTDPSLRTRTLKDLYLFRGMVGGPRQWSGKLYNPEDGHTYAGKVTVKDPKTLSLQGCIVFPLCKTQMWTKLQ